MQLVLDGRNSNSAQIAANYLQRIVRVSANIDGRQAKSPTIANWWYATGITRIWTTKWFVGASLIARSYWRDDRLTSLSPSPASVNKGTLDQLLRIYPLTARRIFVGKAVPALIVANLRGHDHGAGYRHLGIPNSLRRFVSAVLFHDNGDLRAVAGKAFGLLISSLCATQQQAFIGVFVFMMPAILLARVMS